MEIRVETRERHITVVTIANETRRNAMTRAMMADLAALWDRLDGDPECRVVVLTGAGDRAFSSGADLGGDLSASPELARTVNRALLKNTPFSKPIVAAVNGDCVAGGVELLLSTDIRAAVPEARFGLPEVKWSIYPFGGATVKLATQIGHVHAMDLLLTGRLVDAEFAARVGLVNRVVARDRLLPWASRPRRLMPPTARRRSRPCARRSVPRSPITRGAARRSTRNSATGSARDRISRRGSRRFSKSGSRTIHSGSEAGISPAVRQNLT